jgi:prepilin-type N-terminal cleavage/methylation domain-containing protein
MNPQKKRSSTGKAGFTLVEILLVIGLISILGSMAISNFSNASQDTRRVVARQQQAALQNAVNSWVAKQISGNQTVSETRTLYNVDPATTTDRTAEGRLDLVQTYLDDTTYLHFKDYTTDPTQVRTGAMDKLTYHLELSEWQNGSYPKVDLIKP